MLTPEAYRVRAEPNTDCTKYSFYVEFIKPLPAARWGLIFGDAMYRLRAALDHAVYAIGAKESGAKPPPDWKRLQFPITETPGKWKSLVGASDPLANLPKRLSRACNRTMAVTSSLCDPGVLSKSSTTPTSTEDPPCRRFPRASRRGGFQPRPLPDGCGRLPLRADQRRHTILDT